MLAMRSGSAVPIDRDVILGAADLPLPHGSPNQATTPAGVFWKLEDGSWSFHRFFFKAGNRSSFVRR